MADESFGVGGVGRGEHCLPRGERGIGLTVMDRRRGQQAQAPVVMLVVLPVKELTTEIQTVFDAGEAAGEFWPVFERLELALRERVVVGDMWPTVGLGDPSVAISWATVCERIDGPRSL